VVYVVGLTLQGLPEAWAQRSGSPTQARWSAAVYCRWSRLSLGDPGEWPDLAAAAVGHWAPQARRTASADAAYVAEAHDPGEWSDLAAAALDHWKLRSRWTVFADAADEAESPAPAQARWTASADAAYDAE